MQETRAGAHARSPDRNGSPRELVEAVADAPPLSSAEIELMPQSGALALRVELQRLEVAATLVGAFLRLRAPGPRFGSPAGAQPA